MTKERWWVQACWVGENMPNTQTSQCHNSLMTTRQTRASFPGLLAFFCFFVSHPASLSYTHTHRFIYIRIFTLFEWPMFFFYYFLFFNSLVRLWISSRGRKWAFIVGHVGKEEKRRQENEQKTACERQAFRQQFYWKTEWTTRNWDLKLFSMARK